MGGTGVHWECRNGRPAAACAICKGTTLPGALKYRSWKESTGASGPTELYRHLVSRSQTAILFQLRSWNKMAVWLRETNRHLRSVTGAVPSLCSAFLCLPCRERVPTASRQKEGFEQSRKKILLKLHRDPPTPEIHQRLPKTDGYAQKDVFATQKALNSVQLLSLNPLIS